MINRKLVVGILAIVALMMTVQSISPALAQAVGGGGNGGGDPSNDSPMNGYQLAVGVGAGQGTVCWSGEINGCTQSLATITVRDVAAVTFTAQAAMGYTFNAWQTVGPYSIIALNPDITYVTNTDSTNPYNLPSSAGSVPFALYANFNTA